MGQITTAFAANSSRSLVGADVEGERFETTARLVVAPQGGVFEPAAELGRGHHIAAGQVVGHLTAGVERTPVISPFAGETGAPLAWAGERLIAHQPVMWMSVRGGS